MITWRSLKSNIKWEKENSDVKHYIEKECQLVGRNRMIVKFLNRTSSWSSLFLQFKNRDLWTMSERRKGEVQGAHKLDYSQTHSFQGPNLIALMSFNASHRYKASLPCHYRDIMSRLRNLEWRIRPLSLSFGPRLSTVFNQKSDTIKVLSLENFDQHSFSLNVD